MNSLLDIKTLQLMLAVEPFYNNLRKSKKTAHLDESDTAAHNQASVMSSSLENCKQLLHVDDVFSNWCLYVLTVVHSALSRTNAAFFDPILCAEVTLKCSLLLESKAGISGDQFRVSSAEIETPASTFSPEQGTDAKQEKHDADSCEKLASPAHLRSLSLDCSKLMIITLDGLGTGVRDLLNKVVDILDQGLNDIARSRDVAINRRKQNIADISWIKVGCSRIWDWHTSGNTPNAEPSKTMRICEDYFYSKVKHFLNKKQRIDSALQETKINLS
ncbi:uncharacterized protein [Montipora foliosa]|uniref:uncharacterized protein isoform X3 n=1 Tax=Montipora foliosa TaxID=591990 RepID=UPI0035F14AAE